MSIRLLDTFDGRIRLEGFLTTRTGLHIGAGGSGDPLATDAPVVRNAGNFPFIPGSSLKGVIRSAAESLLRGAEQARGSRGTLWSCDQVGNHGCVSHEAIKEIRDRHERTESGRTEVDERAVAEEIWSASCPVCRLFGSLALASRVRFPDLPLLGEAPLTEIRNGVGIDRDKELAASGVLYDFEAVPPETRFGLTVIADNADDWEVGLILFLFEELSNGSLAIGGKTSRGLGQVRVDWQRILETTINGPGSTSNPFDGLLSSRDLLAAEEPAAAPEEEEPSAPAEEQLALPDTGNRADWQALAGLLLAMPEIDKGELGQQAGTIGLNKGNINEKLGLGLEGKVRRVWDIALERLVESGFLDRQDDTYVIAGRETGEEPAAGAAEAAPELRDPALQAAYDRFIGAVKRLWDEEVLQCSSSS
jgi:CRISPR-associated RAMP protein (TIGR02581 family)